MNILINRKLWWNSRGPNPEKEIENACKTVVDVRDVARAHIEAIARDVGGERILLIGGSPHFEDSGRWRWSLDAKEKSCEDVLDLPMTHQEGKND